MVAMINDHHGHGRLMVMAVMVVMGGSQDRKDRQKKLTVKLCVVVVGCIFFLTTCFSG